MLGEPIGKECIKKGKCWDVNRGFLQCTGTEGVMKSVWMWMGQLFNAKVSVLMWMG